MEVEVLRKEKNLVEIKLVGERHTFPNLLNKRLLENPETKFSAYKLMHPMDKDSYLKLETKSKDAKKVLLETVEQVEKEITDLEKAVKKAMK